MYSKLKLPVLFIFSALSMSCGGQRTSEWVTVNSGAGGFSVSMPSKPVETQKTEVTAFGKQVVHFVTWKPKTFSIDKFKLFEVSYTDCPPRFTADSIMLDVMLDSSIKMRRRDFTEKESSPAQTIDLNGYPGKAFMFEVPHDNNVVIVKQCITNNRRYDLVVIARRDQGTNPEINAFFDSFKALK